MTAPAYTSFCSSRRTVTIPCASPPRLSVNIQADRQSGRGVWYAAEITLSPQQVHLLHTAPHRHFVTGPPGTGKTVVLLLMGVKWLLEGHQVHIVCSSRESRVACTMLYRMLLQHQPEAIPDHLRFLQYNFFDVGTDVEKAVNDLSQAATEDSLYVISDDVELGFQTFCDRLIERVPGLHLWAASYFSKEPPDNWPEEYLTRPFRSPPAVVMQVEQDEKFRFNIKPYTQKELLQENNDLETVYHTHQRHPALYPGDCKTCGCQVATILRRLRESVSERTTASGTAQASLEWRDMLVLYGTDLTGFDPTGTGRKDISGLISGLQNSRIPVEIMKDDNIEDVATACTDVVWVTNTRNVRGLERKVVVVVQESNFDIHNDRLYLMSRCSSKLVIVCPRPLLFP